MRSTIVVAEQGQAFSCSFEEIMKYHGQSSPGGVAHAFKVMERAWPLLSPDGAPPERREITVETAFGGPGARDAFEFVTRAVTGERYVVDAALARPERGRALERFVFRVGYRDRSVTLLVRDGYVTDEFIELARSHERTPEEEARLSLLKRDMAERVMAAPAEDVYRAERREAQPGRRASVTHIERTRGLSAAAAHAERFLQDLDERPVQARSDATAIREVLGGPLDGQGEDPESVIQALAAGADAGIVASAGPRHFGFVIGGTLPAALAADWLVSAWDQCAAFHSLSPAAAAIEEIAAEWTLDLLGLPASATVGFVTGGQGANTTALAAARHAVLTRAGWDVESDGLIGAPRLNVVCGEQAHATIYTSLRLLGLGAQTATRIAVDDQGRMLTAALEEALAGLEGPTIVCAQAGNVATGAFDPFEAVADACAAQGAWLHVDGAFGLWAAAAPSTRTLIRGVERADSWAVDAHKWLNVPYDSAMAIVGDADAHRAAMSLAASYLVADPAQRDSTNYVPESSRRARAVPTYAALRSLGRTGVAALVERNCALARRMAAQLARIPGAEIVNDVVLNQVLVRFAGGDEANRAAVAAVQRDGTCWLGGSEWQGRAVMRVSFSNWATSDADVDRSAAAIAAAVS
jgi:glutamate/tyrosine decarboxylase-like PLP-dependent enzyme